MCVGWALVTNNSQITIKVSDSSIDNKVWMKTDRLLAKNNGFSKILRIVTQFYTYCLHIMQEVDGSKKYVFLIDAGHLIILIKFILIIYYRTNVFFS